MKRRVVMLLTVVALMVAMMVAMGAQAFAKNSGEQPPGPPRLSGLGNVTEEATAKGSGKNVTVVAHRGGGTCVYHLKEVVSGDLVYLTLNKRTGAGC
jgi:hypothetical protein